MKKFLCVLTIALTAAITTAGAVAYAENTQSGGYPQLASKLTFSGLTSYAVNSDETQFAFAQDNDIYIFDVQSGISDGTYSGILDNDGTNLYYYRHTSAVTDITYDSGSLIFTDGSSVYTINEGAVVTSSYSFSYDTLTDYNGIYYSIDQGTLYFYAGQANVDSLSDGTYSCLKIYGSSLYVVKDNVLCKVTGTAIGNVTVQPLTFEYLDLTLGETIAVGNAADVLSQVNASVSLVTLGEGTYVTNVDISDLSGSYFAVGSQGTFALTGQNTYLYLGSADNVYIISDGNDVYLTSDNAVLQSASMQSYGTSYALLNTAVNLYSMPYMCDSTAIAALEYGAQVTVNGIYSNEVLQCDFAYVSYTADDGTVVSGYVAANFLTEYDFAAENGSYNDAEYVDEYSNDNVILSVILVLVIVVLVIIGIAFIWYSSTKQKRNGGKQ